MFQKSKSPWRMLLPAASVLVLFGAWTGYWYLAQVQARAALEAERGKLAAKGFSLSCQEESWGGYPFRFEFNCAKPLLRFGDRAEAQAETLLLLAQAYDPKHIAGLAEGPTQVVLPSGKRFEARHDRIVASMIVEGDGLPRVSAVVSNLSVNGSFAAKHLELHSRHAGAGSSDIALDGEAITIRDEDKPPIAADQFQLRAMLASPAKLSIQTMVLRAGKVEVTGSGLVGVDDNRRPAGQINMTVNDSKELLKLIEPHFDGSDTERATLQALLAFLGNGASIAISARNGELFIGAIKAADLEPLY